MHTALLATLESGSFTGEIRGKFWLRGVQRPECTQCFHPFTNSLPCPAKKHSHFIQFGRFTGSLVPASGWPTISGVNGKMLFAGNPTVNGCLSLRHGEGVRRSVRAAHSEGFTPAKLNCLSSLSYGLPSTSTYG